MTASQDSSLNAALGLKEAGSCFSSRFFSAGKPQGGILFLSPYSNRQWSVDDQATCAGPRNLASIIEKAAAARVSDQVRLPGSMRLFA